MIAGRLKTAWWWISDAAWREQYRAAQQRVRDFRAKQRRAVATLVQQFNGRILSGPFAGMNFTPAFRKDACCAQVLLGTYELELRDTVEAICARPYARAVVLGASEGYYLCGLAFRMPACEALGYEMDETQHGGIRELAEKNGVGARVAVRGRATAGRLKGDLSNAASTLIVCDVDGAEDELLDPAEVPALCHADILVETHDHLTPGITDRLLRRFGATHHIEEIKSRERTAADAPANSPLVADEAVGAMDEFRGGEQSWLWMTARNQRH